MRLLAYFLGDLALPPKKHHLALFSAIVFKIKTHKINTPHRKTALWPFHSNQSILGFAELHAVTAGNAHELFSRTIQLNFPV
jgi:hypothetical protein